MAAPRAVPAKGIRMPRIVSIASFLSDLFRSTPCRDGNSRSAQTVLPARFPGVLTEHDFVHDPFEVFLPAGTRIFRLLHAGGTVGQFCQRGGMIADLVSDFRAGVADIPLAEEFVKPAVLDEFGGFDQTQRKGVHAQDIAVEHILIGVGGAAVLGVKMKTAVDADPAHELLDPRA